MCVKKVFVLEVLSQGNLRADKFKGFSIARKCGSTYWLSVIENILGTSWQHSIRIRQPLV